MMTKVLSEMRPSMQKSYSFIAAFIKEKGFGPTLREIKDAGLLSSTSVATYHRDELIKAALITYDPTRERSMGLTGSMTMTFYGDDAEYMRSRFGETSAADFVRYLRNEAAVANWDQMNKFGGRSGAPEKKS